MFFASRRRFAVLCLLSAVMPLASSRAQSSLTPPLAPAPLPAPLEFGSVTLDISGAKSLSSFIAERKTVKDLQKMTAHGLMKFRPGAPGRLEVRLLAFGERRDDQGHFETEVRLEIPRPAGALHFAATGVRRWNVPLIVPTSVPDDDFSPFKPIFRGPDADRDKGKWRRQKSQHAARRALNQTQARLAYRNSAIRNAFTESLQDARDEVEKQLQQALPTPQTT